MNEIAELYGNPTASNETIHWDQVIRRQFCPFLTRKCLKVRKSRPDISIGTCTVSYGEDDKPILICPYRLLDRRQIFVDCLHLLTSHEPGNELHIVPEIAIPGGNVDYFLVSARQKKVKDFLGIEIQTLDTTGTVWPSRQRFLQKVGLKVRKREIGDRKSFGINWKMTAKTTLIQLHHKVSTFENLHKHMVLVIQDCLLGYMRNAFSFNHIRTANLGDPMHFHSYYLARHNEILRIQLAERVSTVSRGIAQCMGLQADANVELDYVCRVLESKLSDKTLFNPVIPG